MSEHWQGRSRGAKIAISAVVVTLLLATPAIAATITVEWTRQFGSAGAEFLRAIATDDAGNVYVAGDTDGTWPGQSSSGGVDAWVRKYDASGAVVWTRQFGTAGTDRVGLATGGVAVGGGGVYVGGFTDDAFGGYTNAGGFDAFLRKYDLNGTLIWTRQFGTADFDDIHDVAVDGDKGVYVAGSVIGALPGQTGNGGSDAYVRRYDPNGSEVWTRQFGEPAYDHANAIAFDATGVYVAGETEGALNGPNVGLLDAYVQRYDRDGALEWTRQFGTASRDTAFSIAADAGGVYVVGFVEGALAPTPAGGRDAFVRKYNPGGQVKWTSQFGTAGLDQAFGVSIIGRALVVSGAVSGPLPGQTYSGGIRDAFVRGYDGQFGDELWTHQFGTAGQDSSFDTLIVDPRMVVYVGGFTTGTLPGQTNSGGFSDAYLRKLTVAQ